MKKLTTMLMIVLACCLVAAAQDSMSGDSMKKDKMQDKTMGKKMSMTGCVTEKDGKYMLMNKEHPDGVQLMSSEDLKPHVGHKVKISGMMMDNSSGDAMKSDEKMKNDNMSKDNMKHDNMGMMSMQVTDMKMKSEQCDMSKMMK